MESRILVGNAVCCSSYKVKILHDYGTFQPIQIASTVALNELDEYPFELSTVYKERRELVVEYLKDLDFIVQNLMRLCLSGKTSRKIS